jgi:hypothetical protein
LQYFADDWQDRIRPKETWIPGDITMMDFVSASNDEVKPNTAQSENAVIGRSPGQDETLFRQVFNALYDMGYSSQAEVDTGKALAEPLPEAPVPSIPAGAPMPGIASIKEQGPGEPAAEAPATLSDPVDIDVDANASFLDSLGLEQPLMAVA